MFGGSRSHIWLRAAFWGGQASGRALEYLSIVLSTLQPAGTDAAEIARLFWIMVAGGAVVWLAFTVLAVYAFRNRHTRWSERAGVRLIVGGGIAAPTVVLGALLLYGMPELSRQMAAAPPGSLRVRVSGEQWWWRVTYEREGQPPVVLANELRLPRGVVSEIVLTSADVIHAFWVPALAGKIDMIPGRTTRLTLEPNEAGTFRGVCAEYCGASHARMAFVVQVVEPADFAAWLEQQSQPARRDAAGEAAFAAAGCAACHDVRGAGTGAAIGPDLTHVGSRLSIAAGTLPNTTEALVRWITDPGQVKPDSLMPPFRAMPSVERRRLAEYLRGLQ